VSHLLKYRLITLTLFVVLVSGACASPTPAPAPAKPAEVVPTKAAVVVPTKAQPGQAADDSWTRVQQAGKLIVGTSADYAPFESYNAKYQIDGYDTTLH